MGVYAILTTGLIEITWYVAKFRRESCRGIGPALMGVPPLLPAPSQKHILIHRDTRFLTLKSLGYLY